jgi:Alginate lyase
VARQIEPDGRQPRELERTRSWDYSIFNLRAFFDLATLSERANLDLWNFKTADGRSLRKALDYLAPFAAGDRKWSDAQITPFRASELGALLRRAAVAWKEPTYRELAMKVGGGSPRLVLTVRP